VSENAKERLPAVGANESGSYRTGNWKRERAPAQNLRTWLVSKMAELTGIDPQLIDIWEPFTDFGLTSKDAVIISGELEDLLGRRLSPALLYDYPSIGILAQHLAAPSEGPDRGRQSSPEPTPVADPLGDILAKIESLSETEAEALLERLVPITDPRGEELR
jgi:acyl carrier protein